MSKKDGLNKKEIFNEIHDEGFCGDEELLHDLWDDGYNRGVEVGDKDRKKVAEKRKHKRDSRGISGSRGSRGISGSRGRKIY